VDRPRKLGLLGSLYVAQGLPYGFFSQALPALLRQLGLSLPAIGLTNLLALPWMLKPIWAPLIDSFGTRKRWILSMQALSVATVTALAFVDPRASMAALLAGVVATNLFASTQDVATDGLAISMLSRDERGLANGIQVAGYRVGMILGGGLLLVVFERAGQTVAFAAMAAMIAAAAIPLALTRDLPTRKAGHEPLLNLLKQPGLGAWLLVPATFKVGHYLAHGMLRPWMIDRGYGLADVGIILGVAGFTAGLLGALAGGWATSRLGRRTALVAFGALEALALGGYLVADAIPSLYTLAPAAFVEHFVSGMGTAALFTCMMDVSRPAHAGTDYSFQSALVLVGSGLAATLSGVVAQAVGHGGNFVIAVALTLIGTAVAAWPAAWRMHRD
jgi:PAT family beta-lactamase induction signal transducer AmpG